MIVFSVKNVIVLLILPFFVFVFIAEISCEVLIKNAHQGPVKAVVVVGFESVSESTSNSSSSSSFSISSSVRENMMIAEPDSDEPQRSSEPTSLHCFEFVSGGMDGAIKFWRGNRRSLLSSSRSKTSKGKSKFLPRYDLQLAGVLVRQSSSSSSFSSTTSSSSSSSSSSGKKADKSKSSSSPAASPVESLAVEPSLLSRLSSTSGRRLVAVGTWVGSLDVYDVSQAMRNLTFDETMSSSASNAVAAASLDMDDDEDDQMSTLSSKRRKASTNGASGDHSLSSFISLPNANERSENSSERTPMFQNCTEVDGSYHPKGDAGNQNVIK